MPLEMFAVQSTANNPYTDSYSNREWRKTKHIRAHIEKTYLINLYILMVRFEGHDAAFNLHLKLHFLYEDGTPMMTTLTPHELADGFAPMAVRHHGDSLWENAADDYYFFEGNTHPSRRMAFRVRGRVELP